MPLKEISIRVVLCMAAVIFVTGCAGYGSLTKITSDIKEIDSSALQGEGRDYTVFSTDTGGYQATMLDPGNDDRTIVAPRWNRSGVCPSLSECIDSLRISSSRNIGLYRVLGPDGLFYGYLLAPRGRVIAKQEGERTLRVYDYPPPPSPP